MSGYKSRAGGWVIACAMLVGSVAAARAEGPAAAAPPAVNLPAADTLPPPLPAETTGTVVPLPPGIYVGLVGLASAAIARRRFLKRR
jgi:hypothetical protein